MTKFYLTSLLLLALANGVKAQDDDMYFTPKKKKSTVSAAVAQQSAQTLQDSSLTAGSCCRDVDEYNRRTSSRSTATPYVVVTDSAGMRWVLQECGTGEKVWVPEEDYVCDEACDGGQSLNVTLNLYADDDDYYWSDRLGRFHGYWGWYDPWYYDPWMWDPWYYGFYSPYAYGWGSYGGYWGLGHQHWTGHALGGGASAQRNPRQQGMTGRTANTVRSTQATRNQPQTTRTQNQQVQQRQATTRTATSTSRSATSSGFSGGGSRGGFHGGGGGVSGGGARGGGGRR